MSEVSCKMAQQSSPSQGKFLSFDMLKRYADKIVQAEKANERKQPISYRSAKFFDDPELNVEDEAFWANKREGFNHDPGRISRE